MALALSVLLMPLAAPSPAYAGDASRPIYGHRLQHYIVKQCVRWHLDAAAVLSVACVEGGFGGAVGDGGEAFGPWQLRRGGALPACIHNPRRWANSPNGVRYAVRGLARVARHLRGSAAVVAIVRRFERPSRPSLEIQRAMSYYLAMKRLAKRLT